MGYVIAAILIFISLHPFSPSGQSCFSQAQVGVGDLFTALGFDVRCCLHGHTALAICRVGAARRSPPAGRAESRDDSSLLIGAQGLPQRSWQNHISSLRGRILGGGMGLRGLLAAGL